MKTKALVIIHDTQTNRYRAALFMGTSKGQTIRFVAAIYGELHAKPEDCKQWLETSADGFEVPPAHVLREPIDCGCLSEVIGHDHNSLTCIMSLDEYPNLASAFKRNGLKNMGGFKF